MNYSEESAKFPTIIVDVLFFFQFFFHVLGNSVVRGINI
jgi:hypothetical protein